MTADLVQARNAVVEAFQEYLGGDVTVAPHGGRFDAQELRRWSRRAPAVLVAVMACPDVADTPGPATPTVQFAAFVVTRDAPAATRDVQVLTLSEVLLRRIPGNRWGLDGGQRPTAVSAENLYSGEIDRLGIAMWAVGWRQGLTLSPIRDASELDDFALYAAAHQVGSGPDTDTRQDLHQEDD